MEVTNRFKGIDLIDRGPERLWMKVHNIVQEAVIKIIPKKKKYKKAKWLSEEALQIAEKREAKDKGEKERYTHLNAESQRKPRRNKKDFLSEQCKEIEENNRMGKIIKVGGGSGWGTHVNPWMIHINVWQKPLQYCKVISLQLIQINENKEKENWRYQGNISFKDGHNKGHK